MYSPADIKESLGESSNEAVEGIQAEARNLDVDVALEGVASVKVDSDRIGSGRVGE